MRLIDIYKETPGGTVLVTAGCIQTGTTDLSKAVQSKFYTMADGTVSCYPVQTAKSEMTLELECTRTQAAAIEAAAALGSLLFAGLRFGTNYSTDPVQPFQTGYRAYLSGSVQIAEKYALSGIYSVKLPLILDASADTYRREQVAAILPTALSVGGEAASIEYEHLRGYQMKLQKYGASPEPAFVRNSVVFTGGSTIALAVTVKRQDYAAGTRELTGTTITIGGTSKTVTVDGNSAAASKTADLALGDNLIDVRCSLTGCRPLMIRIPIYRQAVAT